MESISEGLKKVIQMNLLPGQTTFHHGLLINLSPPNKKFGPLRYVTVQYVTPKDAFQQLEYNNQ